MKIVIIICIVMVLLITVLFYYLAVKSRTGIAPGIDIQHGRLIPCPDSPNCVTSEYPSDTEHFITPIELPVKVDADVIKQCQKIIDKMGGRIQQKDAQYLAATFSSPVFGFVDDFEIRVDRNTQKVHLRSASRVGHSDFATNRKRADLFVRLLLGQLTNNVY